jgi:ATP-binding cassette subfamily C protein
MASLVVLLGSLSYIMVLAIITGSLGFIFAMGVTLLGAVAIAKFLGEAIALSYPLIFSLLIGFGVLRGILRYIEQYTNHYIAFRRCYAIRYLVLYEHYFLQR